MTQKIKKMENKQGIMGRGIIALSVALVLMVGLSSFVSALGVSFGPARGNPLLLAPGEEVTLPLNLQNVASDKDVSVKLSVSQGGEVVSVDDIVYNLVAGSANNYANIRAKVPMTAIIGTEYPVLLTLTTVNGVDQGQGISFGTAMEIPFSVIVIEKPAEGQPAPSRESWISFIAVVLVLIVVLWVLLKRYGKKGKKK